MPDVVLNAVFRPIDATVRIPGSKSLTNRALLLAALADGRSELDGVLIADDTRCMVTALEALGVALTFDEQSRRAQVVGRGARWEPDEVDLDCGAAGTVARFLTAAVCLGHGEYFLDGSARMRQRPIGDLVTALIELGAQITFAAGAGYLPIRIQARGLRGGTVSFERPPSSQFVSALLMVAPLARGDVMIDVAGPLVSAPFVKMTLALMEQFGAAVVEQDLRRFIVPGTQRYTGQSFQIEPDGTAASYFFGAAALTGGKVTVEGLGRDSVQGDLGFLSVLQSMGCEVEQSTHSTTVVGPPEGRLRAVHADLGAMPDVAQTLAVLALFADGPTRISNIANLRLKETDRLAALTSELEHLGAEVEMHTDGLTIRPPQHPRASAIDTFDDHRMAMSFALAGLRVDGVTIRNAECVNKTFPDFFDVWQRMQVSR